MICPYCQTDQEQKKVCSFCEADISQNRPKIKQTLSEDEAYQPQPILATYHTYDLLILLRYLRKKRSFYYRNMQLLRKAPSGTNVPENINEGSQEMYRADTAHMKIIEGILIDRQGYKPKRIDQKLLDALKAKIEREDHHA